MAKSRHDGLRSELNFNDEEASTASLTGSKANEEFPAARVRQAGLSGGETVDGEVTADDLSPETLLHEEGPDQPEGLGGAAAADTDLSEVSEDAAGLGDGLDEAELAQRKK